MLMFTGEGSRDTLIIIFSIPTDITNNNSYDVVEKPQMRNFIVIYVSMINKHNSKSLCNAVSYNLMKIYRFFSE